MTAPSGLALDHLRRVSVSHHTARQTFIDATARVAAQMWDEVDPQNIAGSWRAMLPEVSAVVSGGQLGAARQADGYVAETLAAQGLSDESVGAVEPQAFAGVASDGGGLSSLLANPLFVTLLTISDVRDVAQALRAGRQNLDMLVRTQVADAGRLADQVSMTAHPAVDGYIRQTDGNPCARCLILAGRRYRWNRGFKRHPKCGCVHVAAGPGVEPLDPKRIYDRMSPRERMRAGFTLADQRALADGADIFQVVNARHRPNALLTVAGDRPRGLRRAQRTLEGTGPSSRAALFRVDPTTGRFVPRVAVDRPRWTVDEIYRVAEDDRGLAMDLLGEFGYLQSVTRQPTLRDLRQAAKNLGLRGYSDQTRRQLVERLERSGVFPEAPRTASVLARGVRGAAPGPVVRAPTVTQLRSRVTASGITVPTGLRKPALTRLVDDLDAGVPPAVARERAVRAILEERQAVADQLAEAAQMLSAQPSARAMAFQAGAIRRAVPAEMLPTVRPLLDALDAGDLARARAAVPTVARGAKLRQVGEAGQVSRLDRARMDIQAAGDADTVLVVRPGFETTFERSTTLLRRAEVLPAPGRAPAAKVAKKAAPRKAAIPDLTGSRGLSSDPAVRAVQVENRIRQAYRDAVEAGARGLMNIPVRRLGQSVRLSEVRSRLGELDRAEVDAALRRMAPDAPETLGLEDAQWTLTAADREAGIRFGGENVTMLRLNDPSLRPLPAAPAKKATAAKAAKKAAPKPPPAPAKMTAPALRRELQPIVDAAPDSLRLDLAGVPKSTLEAWTAKARELQPDQLAEEVGRWRQVVVDRRRALADALVEADELLANGASAATMGARARARLRTLEARIKGWPDEAPLRALVTAMSTGNPAAIRRAISAAQRKVGLKQVGDNAGSVGRFDPKAMTPIGGKIPDGAPVTVVRPGYTVEIGGRQVVLSRPVVELAPPQVAPAKVAKKPEIRTAKGIREVHTVRDAETGLRSRVDEIGTVNPDVDDFPEEFEDWKVVEISFGADDANAYATVLISPDRQSVYYAALVVPEELQGRGAVTRLIGDMLDRYKAAGVKTLGIRANANVGGYAWARAGFEFYDDAARREFAEYARAYALGRAVDRYDEHYILGPKRVSTRVDKETREAILRVAGNPNATPADYAMIGHTPGAKTWPGKTLMLGSAWRGKMAL